MNAIETVVNLSLEDAEAAIREALAAQGFGILTEIDVAATLKAKLDIERPPLKILGACNPALAHAALELDPSVSFLLPCNVIIEPSGVGTRVAVVDPHDLMSDPRFTELADDAARRLEAAIASIGESTRQ